MNGFGWIVGGFAAIVGLATVSILVSQKAQTSSVIQALSSGGANLIGAAVAPVTGASASASTLGQAFH